MGGGSGTEVRARDLETPAAVVDFDRVRTNAERTAAFLRSHALSWRPHVKTHKSREIAQIQIEAGAAGLTVATLHEAEAMLPLGAQLLLAHPQVGPAKEKRLSDFLEQAPLLVALDSREALDTASRAAEEARSEIGILIEADLGMGRIGLSEPNELVQLAARAREGAHSRYEGIIFYPGHIRTPVLEQTHAIEELSDRLERHLAALDAFGLPPSIVSGGSTPTLLRSHEVRGMTEVRAGTCIFHDRDSIALGTGRADDVAYMVKATVVSTPRPGRAIVDAGSKALAREEYRGPPDAAGAGGYGLLPDHPGARIVSLSEEHGIIETGDSGWHPVVGEQVRIVPNHVCVSVNLQDRLYRADPDGFTPLPIEGRGRHRGTIL